MSTIWLASGSPRRRQLLSWAGFEVEVHPADVDESRQPGEDPISYARRLALDKARSAPDERLCVAADTVVHLEDRVLDKPRHRDEAVEHLRGLSGVWHGVSTGLCVRLGARRVHEVVTTRVRFRELSLREIEAYVATGDADDKAGAYGIQGRAGAFVAEVQGSWTNVMGLPLERTLEALRELESS